MRIHGVRRCGPLSGLCDLMVFCAANIQVEALLFGRPRYHLQRRGGWILIATTVWIVVNGLVIFGPDGLIWLWNKSPESLLSTGVGTGLITLIGGRSAATPAKKTEDEKAKKAFLPGKLLELALPFTAVIFAFIFVATLSLATTALTEWIYSKLTKGELVAYLPNAFGLFDASYWKSLGTIHNGSLAEWHYDVLYKTPNRLALFIFLIFLLVGVVMGFFVSVNKFSLHSAYRDRLVRAYLGASRGAKERRPNPFTGPQHRRSI